MSSTIFHMSDTHLGYQNRSHLNGHGSTTGIEEADPIQKFDKIMSRAMKEDVDAVIHTGDLFDHDVDQETLTTATAIIGDLWAHNIPFYLILGDHDRLALGERSSFVNAIQELEKMIKSGKLIHTSTNGDLIEGTDIAVFGSDATGVGFKEIRSGYSLTEWSLDELNLGSVPTAQFNILCLHEPVNSSTLENVLSRIERKGNSVELVLLGHEHSPPFGSDWKMTIRNTEIVCAGPTIPISSYFKDSSPGYFRVRIKSGAKPSVDRRYI